MNKKFVYQFGNNKKVINLCHPYTTVESTCVPVCNMFTLRVGNFQ